MDATVGRTLESMARSKALIREARCARNRGDWDEVRRLCGLVLADPLCPQRHDEARRLRDAEPLPPAAAVARLMARVSPAPDDDPDFWDRFKEELKESDINNRLF